MRFGRKTTVRYNLGFFFFFLVISTEFGSSRIIDAFYIVEREIDIEGVDVATNATTVASAFTRYTVAPSTMFSQTTRMTGYVFTFSFILPWSAEWRVRQTAKSKRGKKRATGRRGTVDEWEYLVMSIGRLLARVDEKSGESLRYHHHCAVF